MAISATINISYNPKGNIYEKYRPLDHKNLVVDINADKNTVKKIATDRIALLKRDWRDIYLLKFRAQKIGKIKETENAAGRKAPLAIISSGRSVWIKTMYETGKGILGDAPCFDGIDDLKPITGGDKIPIYFPYRLTAQDAAQRGFYIFVQQNEYQTYVDNLKNTGITVIGYELGTEYKQMLGFGASRYAAVNFLNYIGIPMAWLIDDNILYISRLHEFSFFEATMRDNAGCWALGGTGQARYQTAKTLKEIQKGEQYTPPTNFMSPKFLQQAVLWNIKELVGNTVNFSPYFICSGEDVSISSFLGETRCNAFFECLIYKGCDNNEAVNKKLHAQKEILYNLIKEVDAIPVNTNSTLKDLLISGKRFLKGEPVEMARIKAAEQIQLKYMDNENIATQQTDFTTKLLRMIFIFNNKYDIKLMEA